MKRYVIALLILLFLIVIPSSTGSDEPITENSVISFQVGECFE